MSHRIDIVTKFTGTNADALAGTSLDPMPSDGFIRVYAAEIVDTGTIEIDPSRHISPTGTGGQHIVEGGGAESGAAPNHPIVLSNTPHWETEVSGGEKVTIRLAGTISECVLWTSFMGV